MRYAGWHVGWSSRWGARRPAYWSHALQQSGSLRPRHTDCTQAGDRHQTPSPLRLAAPAARHLAVALALSGVALTASPAAAQPARQSSGAAVITLTGRIAPENFVDRSPALLLVVRVTVTGRAEAAEQFG